MTAPTLATDVQRYLAGVREALADLVASDRDDLLEDLQGHLEELRAEDPSADLVQRLGAPALYAEELRLAARLPAREEDVRLTWSERAQRSRRAFGELINSWPGGRAAAGFLPELRPAWWVLRALGVVQIADRLFHSWPGYGYRWNDSLIPQIHGNRSVGLLVLLGIAILSVRLGRLTPTLSVSRRAVIAVANVVLVLATLSYVHSATRGQSATLLPSYSGSLTGSDGRQITNVFAYDENGQPIERAQLFDQEGLPIEITGNQGNETAQQLLNVFPQRELAVAAYTSNGEFTEVLKARPVVVAPKLSPTPAATPFATPRATPAPKPMRAPSPRPTRAPAPSPTPSH